MKVFYCKFHNTNLAKQIQINADVYKTNTNLKRYIADQFNLNLSQFQLENFSSENNLKYIDGKYNITLQILNPISNIIFRVCNEKFLINNCIQKDFDGIIHQFNQQNIFFSKLLLNPNHIKFKVWDCEIPRTGFLFNCIPEGTFIDVEPHNMVILNYRYFKFIFLEGESVNNAIRFISFYLKGATRYSIQQPNQVELSGSTQLSSKQNYIVQVTNNFTFWQINGTPFNRNFDFLITVIELKIFFSKFYSTEGELSPENIIVYRNNNSQIAKDNDRLIDVLSLNQKLRKFIVFFDIQKVQHIQSYPIIPPVYEISNPSTFNESINAGEVINIHFIFDNGSGLDFTQNVKCETKIDELIRDITSVYQLTGRIEIGYKDRMTNKTVILDKNRMVLNYLDEMKFRNENCLYVEINATENSKSDTENNSSIIQEKEKPTKVEKIDNQSKIQFDEEKDKENEALKNEKKKLKKENSQLRKLLSKKEEETKDYDSLKRENSQLRKLLTKKEKETKDYDSLKRENENFHNEITQKDEIISKLKKNIKRHQMKEEQIKKQSEKESDGLKKFNHYLLSRLCKYEKTASYEEFINGNDCIENDASLNDSIIGAEDEKYHEVVCKIGEGATSDVFKIVDKRTGEMMCKKVIKVCRDELIFKTLQNSLKEIEVQQSIFHPCVCKALGYNLHEEVPQSKKTTAALFFELLPYNVKSVSSNGMLNSTLKTRIAVEVAFGMSHIHSNGIMHRDLKLDNIMMNDVFESKIIDFGLVHVHGLSGSGSLLTKGIGTLAYMSPEMLNEEEYDGKTDVYSYGIVLFELFTGSLPKQKMRDKMNNIAFELPKASPEISEYCIKLIKKCTFFDPSKRPTFDEIIDDMEANSFILASDIDRKVVIRRYQELNRIRVLNMKQKNVQGK